MFFKYSQNNSGGSFTVNNEVCHTIYIEAESAVEANYKAEELGCYWDGVANGEDCPCCGDRWYPCGDADFIDLDSPIFAGVYKGTYSELTDDDVVEEWNEKYGSYEVVDAPTFNGKYGLMYYSGTIKVKNIEEFAQYFADDFGWTTPDARIYYADGTVKEIFSKKLSN